MGQRQHLFLNGKKVDREQNGKQITGVCAGVCVSLKG